MTPEEIFLLKKDILPRINYPIYLLYRDSNSEEMTLGEVDAIDVTTNEIWGYTEDEEANYYDCWDITHCKPYLRPMTSMTNEEVAEYEALTSIDDQIDYLNAHHFDYRGLIEIGLAVEAPAGLYNE